MKHAETALLLHNHDYIIRLRTFVISVYPIHNIQQLQVQESECETVKKWYV